MSDLMLLRGGAKLASFQAQIDAKAKEDARYAARPRHTPRVGIASDSAAVVAIRSEGREPPGQTRREFRRGSGGPPLVRAQPEFTRATQAIGQTYAGARRH